MRTEVPISVPEAAQWHALIGEAEYYLEHLLPEGVEDYLVSLLMRYELDGVDHTYIEGNDELETRIKLRRLGDQCLLLCGFYPEASDEYGVPLKEFVSMGIEAYQKLLSMDEDHLLIYKYLAGNFEQVSDVLSFIHGSTSSENTFERPSYKRKIQENEMMVSGIHASHPRITEFSGRVLN